MKIKCVCCKGIPTQNMCPLCGGDLFIDEEEFTCFNCIDKGMCEYSYDPYNTNGDCLKEK